MLNPNKFFSQPGNNLIKQIKESWPVKFEQSFNLGTKGSLEKQFESFKFLKRPNFAKKKRIIEFAPEWIGSNTNHEQTKTKECNGFLFELSKIDMSKRLFSADEIAMYIPHRFDMAMLDWIIWESQDKKEGLALKTVTGREFWVPGHFPGGPIMPGVLLIETGAQLASFLVNRSQRTKAEILMLKIEKAKFYKPITPGVQLLILCRIIKQKRNIFCCELQGLINETIAFECQITGSSNSES